MRMSTESERIRSNDRCDQRYHCARIDSDGNGFHCKSEAGLDSGIRGSRDTNGRNAGTRTEWRRNAFAGLTLYRTTGLYTE